MHEPGADRGGVGGAPDHSRPLATYSSLDEEETIALIVHFPDSVASFKPRWGAWRSPRSIFIRNSEDHLGQIARIRKAIGA